MAAVFKKRWNGLHCPTGRPIFIIALAVIAGTVPLNVSGFSPSLTRPSTISFTTTTLASKKKEKILVGEAGRKFRRTHYTAEDWPKHRSSDRILKNLSTLFSSGIASQLLYEVGFVVVIAAYVLLWNCLFVEGYDDFSGIHHSGLIEQFGYVASAIKLPLNPFTLASPVLGLLLILRTNKAYSRWWEARKLWGSVVNHTRNIMRVSSGYTAETKSLERLSLAVWSFPRSLTRHLHGVEDEEAYNQEVRAKLDPEYAEDLIAARHKPTKVLFEITRATQDLPLNDFVRMEVDRSSTALCDAMGGCERIFSTPIPLIYTRHVSRFLTTWCLLLPFALYEAFADTWNHVGMLPATFFITFFFFGIEELSIQLEEPFSVLPLHTITKNIGLSCDEYVMWYQETEENEDEPLPEPLLQPIDIQMKKSAFQ